MTNYIHIFIWLTLMGLTIGELLDGQTTSMVRIITEDDPCDDCPVITTTLYSLEPKDSSAKFIKYLATPEQLLSESINWTTQNGEFEIDTCAEKAAEVDAKMMYFSKGVCKTTNDVYSKQPTPCPPTGSQMVYILKGAQDGITTPAPTPEPTTTPEPPTPDTTTTPEPPTPDTTTTPEPPTPDTTTTPEPPTPDTTTTPEPPTPDTTTTPEPPTPDTTTTPEPEPNCEGYSEGSTMCNEPKDCSLVQGGACGPLDEATKEMILGMHNTYRQKVAAGLELRGDPGPQQAGTNMYEMVWDDELARFATRWAENIIIDPHDCFAPCRNTSTFPQTGQNVFRTIVNGPITTVNWAQVMAGWYDEVADVKEDDFSTPSGRQITHYTQLVWATTYAVGCGVYNSNDDFCLSMNLPTEYCQKYVCNYGPTGNFRNTDPYSTTTTCLNRSTMYPNLCVRLNYHV